MTKKFTHPFFILFILSSLTAIALWLFLFQPTRPTIIGINSWTGYDPLLLADEKNLFADNSAAVIIRPFSSTTDEIDAFKQGEIDAAGVTLDEAFSIIGAGFPGKIVLIVDFSQGGDMIIGQKNIHSIAELTGKRIGYEGTVVGEFLLQRALQNSFIKQKSIQLINIAAENWLSSFINNEVDALVCFNPVSSILLSQHSGNLLFSSKDIPFEIIDVLLFSEAYYHTNKPQIKRILQSWFDAIALLNTDLDASASLIAHRKGIQIETYKAGITGLHVPKLKENQQLFQLSSQENIHKYSQNIIDFMLTKDSLNTRISTLDVFDAEIINELKNNE